MVETTTIVSGAVAALAAIFCWVLYKVHGYRQQFPDIPQLPRNIWLGNAKQLDSHKRDKREHPGEWSHSSFSCDLQPSRISYPSHTAQAHE